MRKLWRVSVNWDDKISIDLMLEWNFYEERLETMRETHISKGNNKGSNTNRDA